MKHRWKSICLALLIIVAGGVARLPVEQAYTKGMQRAQLLETPLNLSMRDELGQTLFIAVLGGFRSVVASVVELKAFTPWQQSNWGVVDELYSVCTRLQPREGYDWETRSWHLAVNARDTYLNDSLLTEANRHALGQQFVERGIQVVKEGLGYLPDSWKLWDRLAFYSSMQYSEKPDRAAAAEYYAKAASVPGGKRLFWRFHVYQVAQIPGREREAWDKLMELYNSSDELDHTVTVEIDLLLLYPGFPPEQRPKLPAALERLVADQNLTQEEKRHSRGLLELCGKNLSGNADPAAAAASYERAAASYGGRGFYRRLHVYQVARMPGRERESWSKLLQLYRSSDELDHTLTVEAELVVLFLKFSDSQPEFKKLPPALSRLIDGKSKLSDDEKKHSEELRKQVMARMRPRPLEQAPRVESPGLKKMRSR